MGSVIIRSHIYTPARVRYLKGLSANGTKKKVCSLRHACVYVRIKRRYGENLNIRCGSETTDVWGGGVGGGVLLQYYDLQTEVDQ